jgi:hypothetical protein
MKYRIKKKNLKFYPQKKGWKTLFLWEHFYQYVGVSTYGVHGEYHDNYVKIFFMTLEEVTKFIDDKKSRETKIIQIL